MTPLETLIHEHHALVWRVAYGVLKDAAAAEDVAQDVFVHLLENPGAIEGARSVRAVLAQAARNRALNAVRGDRRRDEREVAVATETRQAPDPAEMAFRKELREKVGALPEDQRSAVELHYFQGMTLPECAAVLEIPEGTVSSRISAALAKLRTALAGAATAGLLAAMERQLEACEEAPVPEGLERRIREVAKAKKMFRRAPAGGGRIAGEETTARGSAPRARAAIVAATALVIFLALLTWKLTQDASETEPSSATTASSETAGRSTASAAAAGTTTATSEDASTKPGAVRTADGILVRVPGGLSLAEPDATLLGGAMRVTWGATPDFPELGRNGGWRFADDARLAGLHAVDSLDMKAFLAGGEAPSLTRLRVRARLKAGDGALREAELLEILEVETLDSTWWSAWRELQKERAEFDAAWDSLPPGAERRAKLVEIAGRAGLALARARGARASQKAPRRAAMMENDLAGSISARLRAVGLSGLLPASPSAWELHDTLMEAETPASLRALVVQRWGEDALWLEAIAVRTWGTNGTGMIGATEIAEASSYDEARYSAFRRDLHSQPDNFRRNAPLDPAEALRRRERFERLGLVLVPAGALERERFLIERGVVVTSVTEDGPAARSGLRAGDVVWRAQGPGAPEVFVDEVQMAELAERWLDGRADGTRLDVVRDDGIATATVVR